MPTMAQNAKSEKRGMEHEKSDAEHPTIHFSFLGFWDRFHVFCNKCAASLQELKKIIIMNNKSTC